ncbi:MAG TPA: polysaccharide biosynthesis tyrosine autokinase [Acidobacteriaceae bacterium]|nr:polysaccharide biosynthesis tyrosine autokinase [Acidobacteriaceae bacterium]
MILLAGLLGFAYGYYKASTQPRVYIAYGDIEIRSGTASEYRVAAAPLAEDTYDIPTQSAILKSDNLLLTVARDLDLPNNPEFTGARGPSPHVSIDDPNVRESMLGALQGDIAIAPMPKTDIVRIQCTTLNAKLSADIVNKLIREYKQYSFQSRYDASKDVSNWLANQLGDLKQQVEASQEQMIDLGKRLGVLGFDTSHNEITSSIDDLTRAASQAQINRIVTESRYRVLTGMDPNALDASIGLVNGQASQALASLRNQRENLRAQLGGIDVTAGPNLPREKSLRAQIAELDREINEEQNRVLTQAKEDLVAARADENQTRGALEAAKSDAYKLRDDLVEYTIRQREFESNRTLYEGLLQRLRTAGVQAGLESQEVDIVDNAVPPVGPSLQPKGSMLVVNTLVFAGVAIILAFILESLDTSLSSVAEIEEISGLPSLALIPKARRPADPTTQTPAQRNLLVLSSPKSQFAEAFRALRTSLLLSVAGREPQNILLTSATPSEGKTTASLNLAAVLAQRDVRVLLIDADLRRPTVHHRFGLNGKVGLTSVLTGSMSLTEAVQTIPDLPSLDVLASGPIPPFPTEMLSSDAMRQLLQEARGIYTHVVMDSPPLLSVTDSVVLAREADAVVLIVRHGKSTKHAVRRARDLLLRSGAKLAGIALNAVDLSSPEYYSYYGYSGYAGYASAGVDSNAWESQGGNGRQDGSK